MSKPFDHWGGGRDRVRLPLYVNNALGLSTVLSLLTLLLIFTGVCLFKRSSDMKFAVLIATDSWVLSLGGGLYPDTQGSFHALERMEYETIFQTTGRIFLNCQQVCLICCDLECGG